MSGTSSLGYRMGVADAYTMVTLLRTRSEIRYMTFYHLELSCLLYSFCTSSMTMTDPTKDNRIASLT